MLVIASGSTVTWGSQDIERHVNIDGVALLGQDPCIQVVYQADTPGSALFVIDDGVLYGANVGNPLAPCTTAEFLPTGAALLPYHCVIHPVTMRAALVVEPAA